MMRRDKENRELRKAGKERLNETMTAQEKIQKVTEISQSKGERLKMIRGDKG